MNNAVAVVSVLLGLVATVPTAVVAQTDAGSDSVMVSGEVFRDCTACPEMVVVPAGVFIMGSPADMADRSVGFRVARTLRSRPGGR